MTLEPGQSVLITGDLPAQRAVVLWQSNDCPECGIPAYRCRLGNDVEALYCSSVITPTNGETDGAVW